MIFIEVVALGYCTGCSSKEMFGTLKQGSSGVFVIVTVIRRARLSCGYWREGLR